MLTRLKVDGFKNLVQFDVHFGAFTCIAGANGVGKSNIFDAIRFLSALADHSLVEAAALVRSDGSERGRDLRDLFHRANGVYAERMTFEVEMIVPRQGIDDLGQQATPMGTFLRYRLELGWRDDSRSASPLQIFEEELDFVTHRKGDIPLHLLFPYGKSWFSSVIAQTERGRKAKFISTEDGVIKRHQEGSGRPFPFSASTLPRTVLSSVNASESETAVMARQEMRSWQMLQFEPAALRKPDNFRAPAQIASNGAHLPKTLDRLARGDEATVYQQVANQLSELLDDVRGVQVTEDEKNELFTLMVRGRDSTWHPAKALSDGTLRFLALAILSLDPEATGVICLEEPENGIHPARIPAMIGLLKLIAANMRQPVDSVNPLRQVIINTHSPAIVPQVPAADLLCAQLIISGEADGTSFQRLHVSAMSDTWRTRSLDYDVTPLGRLLAYLNPLGATESLEGTEMGADSQRVIDRYEVQQLTLFDIEPTP